MEKKELKFYEMKDAKKAGLCLDWLHNRCVYPNEECRFKHQLPPKMSKDARKKLLRSHERANQAEWVKRKERANERVPASRKPRVHITGAFAPSSQAPSSNPVMSMENQTTTTSICEDMSTGSSFPECTTETLEEFVEAPVEEFAKVSVAQVAPHVHMPTDYVPTTLEPPVLSLNANAPEYAPSCAPVYAPSNAGSVHSAEDLYNTMSTSNTPAPSVHGSVYGEPTYSLHGSVHGEPTPFVPGHVAVPTLRNLQYQTYMPHPHTVLMQNLNAQLTAQMNAFKASQEQVHQYQAELTKMQRETEIMMRHHEKAMKKLAFEKSQQQALYEQQLEELRKQTVHALDTAKVQEHRALEHAARLKELETRKMEVVMQPAVEVVATQPAMEVVTQPAVVVREQTAPAAVPVEEVVMPEDTTTFFSSTPMTSLVPAMEMGEVAVPKPAPAKPLSELKPKQADVKVAPEPTRRVRKRRGRKTQLQATPAQTQAIAEEPVTKSVETHVVPSQKSQVTLEPRVVTAEPEPMPEFPKVVEAKSLKVAPKPVKLAPEPMKVAAKPSLALKWSAMRKSASVKTRAAPQLKVVGSKPRVVKKRCIFEIYDKNAIRKAGICMRYVMGLCTSEHCDCWTEGCRCPEGRSHHAYKQVPGFNCGFYHEAPKVKRTKQLSSEERKYREGKLGVKKTRTTKRDRFYRANKKSIEVAKRRAQLRSLAAAQNCW